MTSTPAGTQSVSFCHDTIPIQIVLSVQKFLAGNKTSVFPQPSYSPYLSLAGFFLFPELKLTVNVA
jgi:hypothetical protein